MEPRSGSTAGEARAEREGGAEPPSSGAHMRRLVLLATLAACTSGEPAPPPRARPQAPPAPSLVLDIQIARTAQVFHVVDQLAAWSPFCHSQYARALELSDADRRSLATHAAIRK